MSFRRDLVTKLFGRFLREERAAVTIEAAIWLPIMAFIFVAGAQYFHAYQREAAVTKAADMLGELLSRERNVMTAQNFEGLQDVFEFVTETAGRSYIRFSQVRRINDRIEVEHSYATDGGALLTNARLGGFLDKVPALSNGEQLILVEAYATYAPFFRVGLSDRVMTRIVPISHRETKLVFDPTLPLPSDNTGAPTGPTAAGDGTDGVWINGMWIAYGDQLIGRARREAAAAAAKAAADAAAQSGSSNSGSSSIDPAGF